jgi:hypothetical protein
MEKTVKHLLSLWLILLSTSFALGDEVTLQGQIDALTARVEGLETKLTVNPVRGYLCSAMCTFWWENHAFSNERHALYATGETLVAAFENLEAKCSAKLAASKYETAKWYLATTRGGTALPTTQGVCQLVE